MNHIFRVTLLTLAGACATACSTGTPTTAQQAEAQNSANSFANSLANALPTGAVTNSTGQPVLPTGTTTNQQTSLVQAILSQQHGNLTPAQQTALQQYIASHTQQQPQQQGAFNKNTSIFNKNTAVFNNNNTVFTQNTAIWNKPASTATASNFHPFLGMHHFLHNLLSPLPASSTSTTPATSTTTPPNTSTALPWQNGFGAF